MQANSAYNVRHAVNTHRKNLESQKFDFRRQLENAGIIDKLNSGLVKLYEMKSTDPHVLIEALNGSIVGLDNVVAMKAEITRLKMRILSLEEEIRRAEKQ
jgi:hypothetical protein